MSVFGLIDIETPKTPSTHRHDAGTDRRINSKSHDAEIESSSYLLPLVAVKYMVQTVMIENARGKM